MNIKTQFGNKQVTSVNSGIHFSKFVFNGGRKSGTRELEDCKAKPYFCPVRFEVLYEAALCKNHVIYPEDGDMFHPKLCYLP
jgi:hypothetical protein